MLDELADRPLANTEKREVKIFHGPTSSLIKTILSQITCATNTSPPSPPPDLIQRKFGAYHVLAPFSR